MIMDSGIRLFLPSPSVRRRFVSIIALCLLVVDLVVALGVIWFWALNGMAQSVQGAWAVTVCVAAIVGFCCYLWAED